MSQDSARIRLAHFSDVHLTTRPLGFALRDLATKRLTGWFNWRALGRGSHFRLSHDIVQAMVAEFQIRRPDRLIFSGDATAFGFPVEVAHAARCLHVGALPPGLAVPGNHDYYTKASVRSGGFEAEFAAWLTGERVDAETYPFAQRVGHVWLVAVNSATPNIRPTDASGAVGPAQLNRLRDLLRQLPPGPRILVTHYPVCLADGRLENRWHGLRDLEATVRTAADGGVGLWLHGHRHNPYFIASSPHASFPVICSGSVTHLGFESYAEYEIVDRQVAVQRRVYDRNAKAFRDGERFEVGIG